MWTRLALAWTTLLAFFGCRPTTYTHTIPNLVEVRPGLWRSGQPITDADWKYLQEELHIRHVVKLNFLAEGSDAGATRAGMIVYNLSIQPEGDLDLYDDLRGTFLKPDVDLILQAIGRIDEAIGRDEGVLVHCTHGHDRTGLVIGMRRVLRERWTKDRAYQEMLVHGFHPELHGLHEFWEGFVAPS